MKTQKTHFRTLTFFKNLCENYENKNDHFSMEEAKLKIKNKNPVPHIVQQIKQQFGDK